MRSRLAISALAVATSLTMTCVAGCSSDGTRTEKRPGPLPPVPHGEQPVAGPGTGRILGGSALVRPGSSTAGSRPNLLMITLDDATRADLRVMPHVRRLLTERGTTFTNPYAPSPMCVPARASLITGQYAHNHGALTISGEGGGYDAFDDAGTLPVWLRTAGYDTLFVGKYLNGYGMGGGRAEVPPGWTDWRATADPTTYNFVRPTVVENGAPRTYHRYSTDVLRDLSVRMLSAPARRERPWYLWVNYVAPHQGGPDEPYDHAVSHPDDPHPLKTTTPAAGDRDRFAGRPLPRKPSMFEADVSDKAIVRGVRKSWPSERRAQLREVYQQRLESLLSVDRAVAATIRTLRRTGQLGDTVIVLTSDNGYVTGEHNLDGKLWYFHEIVDVPMVARGPGFPRGQRVAAPVTNADWAPTFAALAGATPTRTLDGVDIVPWLRSPASRRVVPIEAYPVAGGRRPLYTGVVVGPWTYVRARGGRTEVYYRRVDPFQEHNVRHDPRYAGQVRRLARLADRYADCAGETCPREFYR